MQRKQLNVRVRSKVERHHEAMPCYAIFPVRALVGWALESTTIVELRINAHEPIRCSLKRWDHARWFVNLPKRVLVRHKLAIEDPLGLELQLAEMHIPEELMAVISSDVPAKRCRERLSASRKRVITEHVRAGMSSTTRTARAKTAFASMTSRMKT